LEFATIDGTQMAKSRPVER